MRTTNLTDATTATGDGHCRRVSPFSYHRRPPSAQRTTGNNVRLLWPLLLVLLTSSPPDTPSAANALPYLVMYNSRPKCVTVSAPRDTTLLIQYEAPDIVVTADLTSEIEADEKLYLEKQGETEEEARQKYGSGYDRMYYERNKAKMDQMRRLGRRVSDVGIVVTQKGETADMDRERYRRRHERGRGSPGTEQLRQDLAEKEGTLAFDTSVDGTVEICGQSYAATAMKPSRIAFYVAEAPGGYADEDKKKDEKERERAQAERNMNRMEAEVHGLTRKVEQILNQADFTQDVMSSFHDQSLAMNKASQWWPMLQVAMLLVTGFTQAHHVVRFFKSHHIG